MYVFIFSFADQGISLHCLIAVYPMTTGSPLAHCRNLILSMEQKTKGSQCPFLSFLCSLYTNID